ncbi:MerR family transcriptional regulator [Brevibacillus dissolubilis]|uniref:MerR family transcriptional regulator n=1 Tax=Brevibacillus dissolubilis TaxID=1844116 RepID=UPI001115F400|nr:MerR family transcriptional regulator [Brevibacillus dissolubilis]
MYNIKMVSKMLEMPAVTIRAWENRYQVVTPKRSESGHRLYTDQDIEDLRWLKRQVEERGMTISQAVQLLKKKREEETLVPESPSFEGISETLHQSLLSFDTGKANAVLDLAFSMFHYEQVFYRVLAPLMHRIGQEWEDGVVSVAQEHFASNLITQRFMQFFRVFPTHPQLPKVLALCPSGEHHQLGLLLFTLFLRKNGVDVIYLGTNTPNEGLAQVIEGNDVSVVAVSLSHGKHFPVVSELVAELSVKFPKLRFVIGGQGVEDKELPDDLRPWAVSGDVHEWQNWYQQEMV